MPSATKTLWPMHRADRFPLLIGLFVLVCAASVQAQDTAQLTLETNAPEALVLANGDVLGRANTSITLPVGTVILVLVEDAGEAWQPRRATTTIEVAPGEHLVLTLNLPVRYRIETLPIGATVVLEAETGREVLGVAPLMVERTAPLSGALVAEREGFLSARLAPGDSLDNRHTILMRPLEDRARPEAAVGWMPPRRSPSTWIDIAAAGVALAAAGVAVHYKFRADNVDDRYRQLGSLERGDPVLKAEAERLDTYSLAALGVMQVGVGVLAVRFILR